MANKYQLTLALLKPDLAVNSISVKAVTEKIMSRNLAILDRKVVRWKRPDSEAFYRQHKGKFFYQRLVEYTTCGPILALVLAGQNAIREWRSIMGPTKTFQAGLTHPYSIRGQYGLSDTRNSTHGSDSEESADAEIELLFGQKYRNDHSVGDLHNHDITRMSTLNLGKQEVWEAIYHSKKESTNIEWFLDYKNLTDYILPPVERACALAHLESPAVLDIGCGDSTVGPSLARDLADKTEVYCVDFASEALLRLRLMIDTDRGFDHTKNYQFIHGDICSVLPFEPGSISAIIDKGTIDSILKQRNGEEKASKALQRLLPMLHSGGVFLQITDEPPETRLELLQRAATMICSFSISCQQLIPGIGDGENFLYTVSKS